MLTMMSQPTEVVCGSLDGHGSGDHDVPFRFGRRPWANAPFPFSPRQYGRLLVLRGRVQDRTFGDDDQLPASLQRGRRSAPEGSSMSVAISTQPIIT